MKAFFILLRTFYFKLQSALYFSNVLIYNTIQFSKGLYMSMNKGIDSDIASFLNPLPLLSCPPQKDEQ